MSQVKTDTKTTDLVEKINAEVMLSPEVQALIAAAAQTQGDAEASSIAIISLKNKRFTIGDTKLGTSLDVIILADAYDHAYYDKPYNPDVISPPACFAINTIHANLAPEPDKWFVPEPQAEKCQGCPQNEFETARQGKGKACRNGRRLLVAAVINGVANLKDLALINIPPSSLKSFSRYVKQVATGKKLPLWAVVTNFEFDDEQSYPFLIPTFVGLASPNDVHEIAKSLPDFEKTILTPYDCSGWVPLDGTEETTAAASTAKKSKMS
jgi:hypothetical protein